MYYTSKTEYQCYDINGHYQGVALDMWIAAERAGEGGEIVLEHSVGESKWTVRDGLVYRTR